MIMSVKNVFFTLAVHTILHKLNSTFQLLNIYFIISIGFISPLCLPIDNYASTNHNLAGKIGIIAGWGASVLGKIYSFGFVVFG